MKLHMLGWGDAFGNGGRNQSGYLVEAADRLFLMDCGPTTLLAMKGQTLIHDGWMSFFSHLMAITLAVCRFLHQLSMRESS
jgi:ribonuclease BN (tRNA processing enzyme)